MNTDTGAIYRTPEAIESAKMRGEQVVEVSEHVAEMMEYAQRNFPTRQGLTAGQMRRAMREAKENGYGKS